MSPASQRRRSQRAAAIKSSSPAPRSERWVPPFAGARPPGVAGSGWREMRDLLPPLSSYVFSREASSRCGERLYKSESDAWRRSTAAVFPLPKCRHRLSLKGDASRKPLSSSRLLLKLGRHWLPRVSRSGGVRNGCSARRARPSGSPCPAPPRRGPRPGPRRCRCSCGLWLAWPGSARHLAPGLYLRAAGRGVPEPRPVRPRS